MNTKKINELKNIAHNIAMINPDPNRHISIILKKKKIVAIGTNGGKSHTEAKRRNYWSEIPHSELAAFMRVHHTMRDNLTLINFRFNKRGEMRLSRPCHRCLPWCKNVFKEIHYSTDLGMEQLK